MKSTLWDRIKITWNSIRVIKSYSVSMLLIVLAAALTARMTYGIPAIILGSLWAFCYFKKCRVQLNDFFVLIKFPGSKWWSILQVPDHREIRKILTLPVTAAKCRKLRRLLAQELREMPEGLQEQKNACYRTCTHTKIKEALERLEEIEIINATRERPLKSTAKMSLRGVHDQIMKKACYSCPHSLLCKWRQECLELTSFYYIEFRIKK